MVPMSLMITIACVIQIAMRSWLKDAPGCSKKIRYTVVQEKDFKKNKKANGSK